MKEDITDREDSPVKATSKDDEVFLTIKWSIGDLKDAFEREGIHPTKENIQAFVKSRFPGVLKEVSTEEGWEILELLVEDFAEERGIA